MFEHGRTDVTVDDGVVAVTEPRLRSPAIVTGDGDATPALLVPSPNGPAARFAAAVGPDRPVRVFVAALLAGYALLVAITVLAGLALTRLILPAGVGAWDDRVARRLEDGRTPFLEDLSWVGSTLAGGHVIPVVVGSLLVLFALQRRWVLAAFALFGVAVESATYRATTLVVERERPPVERLEQLPVDASFPSGHTAASVALFGGLLVLLASRVRRPWFTVVGGRGRASIAVFVAWSRMVRGMHHVTDVVIALGMGALAVVVVVFACRAAVASRRGEGPRSVTKLAVVAHAGKTMGGGLDELRSLLDDAGVEPTYWSEVPKSRFVPERVERALEEGAELVLAWGGDGTVQRAIDVLAGTDATLAILPAGTANLFASNLGVPTDLEEAVEVALDGDVRTLDVGRVNGERFAVMAGVGLDATMIADADGELKDRFGRLAYVWTASKGLRAEPFRARIEVNGELWYDDEATCVLLGNVGSLFGGVDAFDSAAPDDGLLELGVAHAQGLGQWARTIARTAVGTTAKSPFVQMTKARKVKVELDRKVLYELDGGDRKSVRKLKAKVEPGALSVKVPREAS